MGQRYSVNVKVAGVNIQFISEMEVDICDLRILFKHHLADPPADGTFHTVEIRTVHKSIVPDDARQVWQGYYHGVGRRKGESQNTIKKYISADGQKEYFLTTGGECIVNDLTTGMTICTLINKRQPFKTRYERSKIGTIIILLVHVVMAYHRRYTLHAAAVVWKERAIVFTGKSGQGKSTLCTDLVAQGAGFLGDDIVFIYMDDGKPQIASLLFDAKLFESSKKDKDFIDILERYRCQHIESVPLQAIAEIHQTREGASTLTKETDEDRLLAVFLTAANNIALQYDHDDWMTLCASVMGSSCLYTFHFGDRKLLNATILDEFYGQ